MQQETLRLGVVNYLNASPLIDGISSIEGIKLIHKVPSELVGCLERDEVDFALASSIDYQKSKHEFSIMPVGVLSSEGETLTVRLCSQIPLEQITEVHCDIDSHTSIALLQIVLQKKYGVRPNIISCDVNSLNKDESKWAEAVLMIGDKVVTSLIGTKYPIQLDLGEAWAEQTGLPFVFAMWFGEQHISSTSVHRASIVLDRQRRCNALRLEQVVSEHARSRGWDVDLAFRYVTKHIQYTFTQSHKESLELFFELYASLGILDEVVPLRFYTS
jgi:chorismate dehydratase